MASKRTDRKPQEPTRPTIQVRAFFAGELVAEETVNGPLVAMRDGERKGDSK